VKTRKPASRMTQRRRQQIRTASKRYYQRVTFERRALGLTTRGQPFKRGPYCNRGLLERRDMATHLRRLNRDKWQRRAARLKLRGLTTRGTKPQYRRWTEVAGKSKYRVRTPRDRARDVLRYRLRFAPHLLPGRLELSWRDVRAEMGDVTIPDVPSHSLIAK